MTPFVLSLDECTPDHAPLVGGKAVGLGRLLREGMRVPPGFVVTTAAYRARPPTLPDEIAAAYSRLCGSSAQPVAIRSSATAEDLADASFAGQQETYLWILGAEQVVQHVERCWASLFSPQATAYRAHRNLDVQDLAMGVVVQRMVPAEAAGVMLTIDPVNGDPSQIAIEAAYGLGAAVVNGEVTPDRFGIDKVTLEIRARALARKPVAYRFEPSVQGIRLQPVPDAEQAEPCLTDPEIVELASLGKRLERALGAAQDIEWAIAPGREIFLLQTRPETVWSQKPRPPLTSPGSTIMQRILQSMRVPTTWLTGLLVVNEGLEVGIRFSR